MPKNKAVYGNGESHYLINTESAYKNETIITRDQASEFMSEEHIESAIKRARELKAVARFVGSVIKGKVVTARVQYSFGDEGWDSGD